MFLEPAKPSGASSGSTVASPRNPQSARRANYNRPVRLPYAAGHERLWRDDGIYDVIVVLGHNDDPPVPGRGSAVFLHVARSDYGPTAGCVALALVDLLTVLREAGPEACVRVEAV